MAARQRIDRVRRQYNQWVANETLEDYALRFTAKSARRWSAARVANTALGAISFLALEAIGAAITLNYGTANAAGAILAVSLVIFLCGLPIAYYAARYGVDIDLLTRGAGFGYIGSTITSLIYASFTFIFFAIEGAIMAMALQLCFGLPLPVGYLVCAIAIIPLATHGVTLISRFQLWTQPIWIALQLLPFAAILHKDPDAFSQMGAFTGRLGNPDGGLDLLMFGSAASVVFALVAQIGEQVDFLRFLPRDRRTSRRSWWIALLAAGPGWIVVGALKLLAGSFLAVFALNRGVAPEFADEPAHLYLAAFRDTLASPAAALTLTGVFVIVSQLKINVTNAYAGSIAWSNFFSRLTHSHPGRVVWLVFNVAVALLLMEIGVFRALEQTLALYSNVAVAWVGALVADLVINKPLGLRPRSLEFKRAHLYDINPVGVGAMATASIVSILAFYGLFGSVGRALSPFVALGVALATAPAIAWATGGKYYYARKPKRGWEKFGAIKCCICEHPFEPEDMSACPAYAGPICSLCCSLDARCHDMCKPRARLSSQLDASFGNFVPAAAREWLRTPLARYLAVFSLASVLFGLTLEIVFLQSATGDRLADTWLFAAMARVYFAIVIVIAVVAWLFVLAQQSRGAAEAESRRQTALLLKEIDAHGRTDAALQRAREVAEAANLAKSRYVVGLSHELRSPLNAISGYAQLLEQDQTLLPKQSGQIGVIRRSAGHLSGLIDGILDISKIEAGRIDLSRDEVRLTEFLEQLAGMFGLQAAEKRIDFIFERPERLPSLVYADEKRLRQILINLLSNAVKFTQRGSVRFTIRYRSPFAEFHIADTGPGIQPGDIDRIFAPFERGSLGVSQPHTGTGLGLTISKLLTGVMGGDLKVKSEVGEGSLFRVKMLLSEVTSPAQAAPIQSPIFGYFGPRKTILVTDDDPAHRELLREVLSPLEFIVLCAPDGPSCLDLARHCQPDLFLLDISMAGVNGWKVAELLRAEGHRHSKILMVSASALEAHSANRAQRFHDGYLMKPIDIPKLLEEIGHLLRIEWRFEPSAPPRRGPGPALELRPPPGEIEALIELGKRGHVRGAHAALDRLSRERPECGAFLERLRLPLDQFDFARFLTVLDAEVRHDG